MQCLTATTGHAQDAARSRESPFFERAAHLYHPGWVPSAGFLGMRTSRSFLVAGSKWRAIIQAPPTTNRMGRIGIKIANMLGKIRPTLTIIATIMFSWMRYRG